MRSAVSVPPVCQCPLVAFGEQKQRSQRAGIFAKIPLCPLREAGHEWVEMEKERNQNPAFPNARPHSRGRGWLRDAPNTPKRWVFSSSKDKNCLLVFSSASPHSLPNRNVAFIGNLVCSRWACPNHPLKAEFTQKQGLRVPG